MQKITNLIQINKKDFVENLDKMDKNTLYFVIEEDSEFGYLYLGNKSMRPGNTELAELDDVLLQAAQLNNSFLVYDNQTQKWVNKNKNDLVFIGTNGISNGIAGLVPGPSKDAKNYFLRGDGIWAPAANFQWKEF